MIEDLYEQMFTRMAAAKKKRPDVPLKELLVTLTGEEKVRTFAEVNAEGEPMLFVCIRCEDCPSDYVVPGSKKKKCGACQNQVWMSPTTEWSMNKLKNTRIRCLGCASKGKDETLPENTQADR